MYTIRELANLIAGTTNLTASEAFNYMIDGFPNSNRTMKEALAHLYGKGDNATAGETLNSILGTTGKTVQECLTDLYNRIVNLTPLTLKGGVVRVIDSATGDIARTTTGWIEDEKYGVYFRLDAGTASAEFDTSDVMTAGHKVAVWTTTGVTSKGRLIIGGTNTGSSISPTVLKRNSLPVKPSTHYNFFIYVKYENIVSVSNLFTVQVHEAGGTRLAQEGSGVSSGNSDGYKKILVDFTTGATAAYCLISFSQEAGDNQIVKIDPYSMTLEEVSTITNSGSVPALFYPKATAVTSNDNIDQSQVVKTNSTTFGRTAVQDISQTFTLTKKNFYGVSMWLQKLGTPTDNLVVTIEGSSSDSPDGNVVKTYTIDGSTISTTAQEYSFPLPYTASIQKYAVRVKRSGSFSDTDAYIVFRDASQSYSGGVGKYYNGSAWSALASLYFKTLYSKNTTNITASIEGQDPISITAPTTDGWENGTVINTATLGIPPLVLAPGANTVYFSSNGPATADGTVDPSLQAIIGGKII